MSCVRKSLLLLVIGFAPLLLSRPAFAEGPLDLELQIKTGDEIPGVEGQIVWVGETLSR